MLAAELAILQKKLEGELYFDKAMRILYATDASAFREMPLAVAFPKHEADIAALIHFATKYNTTLIPRTAGTSLAGQVVGNGIVVDVTRYFNKILEINAEERWVKVQPGVVRDELNMALKPYGLFFAPETSTANRAMVGGMVGNNSCGANSVIYKSTREHLLAAKAVLHDGKSVWFEKLNNQQLLDKISGRSTISSAEHQIYTFIYNKLSDAAVRQEIKAQYPKASIPRRNTGYAIDIMANGAPFNPEGEEFNMCKLIAGSEGTLCVLTELKLNIVPLPPPHSALICIHCADINESLLSNLIALKYAPRACELIDHYILECTNNSIEYRQYRWFVKGEPGAILVVELAFDTEEELNQVTEALIEDLKTNRLGYHYPVLKGEQSKLVWQLRKAGLGLLSNMPGDYKPVPVVEDTAVDVQELPAYIAEFNQIMASHGLYSVHYAHAGSGELHLRPILNLKTSEGKAQFRMLAEEIADLVKKYQGSLSGEHGDGRLRAEFIPKMVGEKNYRLLKELKAAWDPYNVFNAGKIVDAPPMNEQLRYLTDAPIPEIKTHFDFGEINILQHAEQCNGSGDCRKSHLAGGTMCPSYMATKNEKDTTRARANILRELLTRTDKVNRFDHEEILDVMDLCLSCKGCKSECPSNVDVGKLKAEFLQQYYEEKGFPLRSQMIGHYATLSEWARPVAPLYNFAFGQHALGKALKLLAGFHPNRSMPKLHSTTLLQWFTSRKQPKTTNQNVVYLFCDEFTNFQDVEIGKKAIMLLEHLGYNVRIPKHKESGRAFLSKGMLKKATQLAEHNVEALHDIITADTPLIGIEPSAILTFKDEYPDLLRGEAKQKALALSKNVFTIDAFIANEAQKGAIHSNRFEETKQKIYLHGHCHQKALTGLEHTKKMLSIPIGYEVYAIASGCCGMAGSFGYEKEHYDISQKIGELVLFPAVRKAESDAIIAAPGTSCRHQILDGTQIKALHPVEILWKALKKPV
jgi:FAD/FMN-containing dehydrogenase/Fe-S oxidoreductase